MGLKWFTKIGTQFFQKFHGAEGPALDHALVSRCINGILAQTAFIRKFKNLLWDLGGWLGIYWNLGG